MQAWHIIDGCPKCSEESREGPIGCDAEPRTQQAEAQELIVRTVVSDPQKAPDFPL